MVWSCGRVTLEHGRRSIALPQAALLDNMSAVAQPIVVFFNAQVPVIAPSC